MYLRYIGLKFEYKSQTTESKSPTTDYKTPTTDYKSPTTDYKSPTTDYKSPTTDSIKRMKIVIINNITCKFKSIILYILNTTV